MSPSRANMPALPPIVVIGPGRVGTAISTASTVTFSMRTPLSRVGTAAVTSPRLISTWTVSRCVEYVPGVVRMRSPSSFHT